MVMRTPSPSASPRFPLRGGLNPSLCRSLSFVCDRQQQIIRLCNHLSWVTRGLHAEVECFQSRSQGTGTGRCKQAKHMNETSCGLMVEFETSRNVHVCPATYRFRRPCFCIHHHQQHIMNLLILHTTFVIGEGALKQASWSV